MHALPTEYVYVFTQPLRMEVKVNFKRSKTWFKFRIFFLLDWLPNQR